MKKICVIDYDSGNIKSVYNALRMILVGTKNSIVVSSKKEKIKEASHVILPGVGSFNTCIEGLKQKKFLIFLKKRFLEAVNLFLEFAWECKCYHKRFRKRLSFWAKLDSGKVTKISQINESMKIPHMGWNKLIVKKKIIL